MAALFLIVIFFLKNKTTFKNEQKEQPGLAYSNEVIGDLVTQDTDLDGVPDWEENLMGTDPNKKDADLNDAGIQGSMATDTEENLTETEKFSREFFSTVATLSQAGQVDQNTVDQLSSSLADRIQSTSPKKIYALSEIKIINDNSTQAMEQYNKAMGLLLHDKYPRNEQVFQILSDSLDSSGNIDPEKLSGLDLVIKQLNIVITGMQKIDTPSDLSLPHLALLNSFQQVDENLLAIENAKEDPIVAMGALSKYGTNVDALDNALAKLNVAVKIN